VTRRSRLSERDLVLIARVRDDLRTGRARQEREAAGLKVAEIAERAGVTPAAVRLWERCGPDGKPLRVPDAAHALAYGRALEAVAKSRSVAA
jgi:transcriptional regulator with XRE-family HTH domain